MSVFYIDSKKEGIFELTSTSDIRVVQSSNATKHALEGGDTATDNIVNQNTEVSFNGIISDILRLNPEDSGANSQRNVEGFITSLRRLRDNKELFTVYYDDREFGVAENCYITNISLDRSSTTGAAYQVGLSFEQVRVVKPANITVTRDTQASPDDTQGKTTSGGSNTEDVDVEWKDQFIDVSTGSLISGVIDARTPPDGGE